MKTSVQKVNIMSNSHYHVINLFVIIRIHKYVSLTFFQSTARHITAVKYVYPDILLHGYGKIMAGF